MPVWEDPAVQRQALERLRELRSDGIRRTRFETEEVEFRSDAELAAAITDLERRLNGNRIHTVKLHSSKGF